MRVKKQKGSGFTSILGIFTAVLFLFVGFFIFHLRMLNFVQESMDGDLKISLLGGTIINIEEYGRTGQTVIHDTVNSDDIMNAIENASFYDSMLQRSYNTFLNCLKTNMNLDEMMKSPKSAIISPIEVEEYKIFNVYKKYSEDGNLLETKIYEFTYANNAWTVIAHAPGDSVYVAGAGNRGHRAALVEDTTVYAKLSFDIKVFPYMQGFSEDIDESMKTMRVSVQRSISVPVTR